MGTQGRRLGRAAEEGDQRRPGPWSPRLNRDSPAARDGWSPGHDGKRVPGPGQVQRNRNWSIREGFAFPLIVAQQAHPETQFHSEFQ